MLSLRLTQQQVQDIVEQARDGSPQEVCGLIAGEMGVATQIISISNQSSHPETHFNMDANELLRAYKSIDSAKLGVLAVYHSHPNSDPVPSQTDIRESMTQMPNVIHLIVSLKQKKARLQTWYYQNGRVNKSELLVGKMQSRAMLPLSRAQIITIIFASIVAVIFLLMISYSLLPPAPPIPTPQ